MNANELRAVVAFENTLTLGDAVTACWTSSGYAFTGRAKLTKINGQSFRVELTEHVAPDYHGGYPVGTSISVPRFAFGSGMKLWTANNRIEPTSGYATVEGI